MQLSETTRKVLENFVSINSGIVIRKTQDGMNASKVSILSKEKTIYGEVMVPETFENNVCLYDLPKLLRVASVHGNPEIVFNDNHLVVTSGKFKEKMMYAAPETIMHAKKEYDLNQIDATFDIDEETLGKVLKLASIMGLPTLQLYVKDSILFIQAVDTNNSSSDASNVEVGPAPSGLKDGTEYFIKMDYMKMLPGNYEVSLTPSAAVFKNKTIDSLKYIVALSAGEDTNG